MTEKLSKHFNDTEFIPFTTIADVQSHLDWLQVQLKNSTSQSRKHWLHQRIRRTQDELKWRHGQLSLMEHQS